MFSVRGMTIPDLHIGAVPLEQIRQESRILIETLINTDVEYLIQLGDYFHKRLGLDSEESKFAIDFINELASICQSKNIPFRQLKGTLTHDFFQLDNYKVFETTYPCYKIIDKACSEELLPGFHVLYLPEEYPEDYETYYKPFFEDEEGKLCYHAIFGHGEIDVAAHWGESDESERKYSDTPCHSAERLLEHSLGIVWFGHIHTRFVYKERLGFSGCFSRWCFGEEKAKGFDIIDVEEDENGNMTTALHFIENTLARKYRTIQSDKVFPSDSDITFMQKVVRKYMTDTDFLRIEFTTKFDYELIDVLKAFCQTTYHNRVKIENKFVYEGISQLKETQHEDITEVDEYLEDPALKLEEKLLKYVEQSFPDSSITMDDISDFLSQE